MTNFHKPFAEQIITDKQCEYGCGEIANYQFKNRKICCSIHFNSCVGKRKAFGDLDHKERTDKSLATRIEKGITKSSQIKGGETRRNNGHYDRLAKKMQERWEENPWNTEKNTRGIFRKFPETNLAVQSTYEENFIQELINEYGIAWVNTYVNRGPSVYYIDPLNKIKRLYISDFIIENVVYEIKSSWTWNETGRNMNLENKNKAKLSALLENGYQVKLILNGEETKWV